MQHLTNFKRLKFSKLDSWGALLTNPFFRRRWFLKRHFYLLLLRSFLYRRKNDRIKSMFLAKYPFFKEKGYGFRLLSETYKRVFYKRRTLKPVKSSVGLLDIKFLRFKGLYFNHMSWDYLYKIFDKKKFRHKDSNEFLTLMYEIVTLLIFRFKFVNNFYEAQRFVKAGHFYINDRRIYNPFTLIGIDDFFTFGPGFREKVASGLRRRFRKEKRLLVLPDNWEFSLKYLVFLKIKQSSIFHTNNRFFVFNRNFLLTLEGPMTKLARY